MKIHTVISGIVALLISFSTTAQEKLYFGINTGAGITKNYVKEIQNVDYQDKLEGTNGLAVVAGGIIGFTMKYGLSLELGINRVLKTHSFEAQYEGHSFSYRQSRFATEIPLSLKFRPRLHGFSSLAFNFGPSLDIYDKNPYEVEFTEADDDAKWAANFKELDYTRISPSFFFEAGYERRTKGYATWHIGFAFHFLPDEIFLGEYSRYKINGNGTEMTDFSNPRSYGHYYTISLKYFIFPFRDKPFDEDSKRKFIFDKNSNANSKDDKY